MSRIFLKARRPPRRVDVSDVRRLVSTLGGNNFAATSAVSDSWVDNHLLEEKVEKYTVNVPYTVQEEVDVTVCKMVPTTVTVPVWSNGVAVGAGSAVGAGCGGAAASNGAGSGCGGCGTPAPAASGCGCN